MKLIDYHKFKENLPSAQFFPIENLIEMIQNIVPNRIWQMNYSFQMLVSSMRDQS